MRMWRDIINKDLRSLQLNMQDAVMSGKMFCHRVVPHLRSHFCPSHI